ncbi:hypothetical protein SCALM49S_04386 [Streptomyces californicus]
MRNTSSPGPIRRRKASPSAIRVTSAPSASTSPRPSSRAKRKRPRGGGDGDELIYALIDAGGHDQEWLTEEQLAKNPVRIPAADYRRWFAELPEELRTAVEERWGPAPGEMFVDRSANPEGDIVLAALRRGNLLILIQPPRGFSNPIAIYHDPDLPPSHHYLAAYRWIAASAEENGSGADAMIHLGKHGNLEWLPGKNAGLSAACGPDAALGDLPLVYPFLVNDPGEGTQAKRRVHATLIDHLVPPMARADSYGDIARLEQLLDEHAQIAAMDPAKLPAIRAQIWTLIQAAKLDHDLGVEDRPEDEGFDDFIMHLDGWLCEIKDVQIRDGLHVLGNPPPGTTGSTWSWPCSAPGRSGAVRPRSPACARRSAWTSRPPPAPPPTRSRSRRAPWSRRWTTRTGRRRPWRRWRRAFPEPWPTSSPSRPPRSSRAWRPRPTNSPTPSTR